MSTLQLDKALAEQMVEKALNACAAQKFNGDARLALQTLHQGRCDLCCQVSEHLVGQLAEYLGQVDHTVKGVYRYEPELTPQRTETGDRSALCGKAGINLVAWVDRKSAALNALGTTLESLINESRRKIGCDKSIPACYVLDIQMVDDHDIQESRSYAMMVQNTTIRSMPVWKRVEQTSDPANLGEVGRRVHELLVSFNPELAPEISLFEQARAVQQLPPEERSFVEHHLEELKVVLIRRLISDQLAYIQIARDWFTIDDLFELYQRKIGGGRVGGKAAGMLLAHRILREVADKNLLEHVHIPESYFLGSDLIYLFNAMNGLMHWNDQKYKSEDQIRTDYPQIETEFQRGTFPPEILAALQRLLERIGNRPVIVRSSSLLEDNFGTSFAGKYNSYFLANQGTPQENLTAMTRAIALTYASTLKPEALLYRRSKGLQDYDERMAVLIQVVQGERRGRYFLPFAAGVAFSRNLYRWAPQIRREDGFARMVWGLGTRAVERVGNDYPRLVALSHPALQPSDAPDAIRHYSQQYVDLIDLEENTFKTLPFREVLSADYPGLRFMAQLEEEGYFSTLRGRVMRDDLPRLAITYTELMRRTRFPAMLASILKLLEKHYHVAVDMEFTLQLSNPDSSQPEVDICLLQCRPQSHMQSQTATAIPANLEPDRTIFSTRFMVPQGHLPGVRHVLFVTPEGYFSLPNQAARNELTRAIAKLNVLLEPKSFICVGPGRWGTTNPDLGVFVSYGDIYNAGALVELAGKGIGPAPEPSLGTHFFQDLMEAQIYPVAISFDESGAVFNHDFFYNTPNCLPEHLEVPGILRGSLRLIDVEAYRLGQRLELVMDDEKGQATAFLSPIKAD